jgi:leucyl aminopeptidase
MDVRVVCGAIHELSADTIILSVFEGARPEGAAKAADAALEGAISDLMEGGDLGGKAGEIAVLYPRGAIEPRRVIVAGMGPREKWNADSARRTAAGAIKKARALGAKHVVSVVHAETAEEPAAQATVEGMLLALYSYQGQKSDKVPDAPPQAIEVAVPSEEDVPAAERGAKAGAAVAAGVALTRDLVNQPPNVCTPVYMADAAREAAKTVGLHAQVLERKQMEALGMGALLAVAQGSDTPPRFIILEHNADRAEELDTIVLVGKGITFDTGGYNLKPTEGLEGMKADMAGAAAVIGAMRAIGELDVPLHVVGLAPAADNMISGHSYRPQEVVTASNGVTIEVMNTDAEGRMLLADALVFATRYNPTAVVDIATLTGAKVIALGPVAAAVFGTEDRLRDSLVAAGEAAGEKLWPMPLFPEYEKSLESATADVKNTGGKRSGVGSSATFLKHFVSYPWAHVDIAGMAFKPKGTDNPYQPRGATGFGTRLLIEFVRSWVA